MTNWFVGFFDHICSSVLKRWILNPESWIHGSFWKRMIPPSGVSVLFWGNSCICIYSIDDKTIQQGSARQTVFGDAEEDRLDRGSLSFFFVLVWIPDTGYLIHVWFKQPFSILYPAIRERYGPGFFSFSDFFRFRLLPGHRLRSGAAVRSIIRWITPDVRTSLHPDMLHRQPQRAGNRPESPVRFLCCKAALQCWMCWVF